MSDIECILCNKHDLNLIYEGDIRDGIYPKTKKSKIFYCSHCNVETLDPSQHLTIDNYSSDEYRSNLDQFDPYKHESEHFNHYLFANEIISSMPIKFTGETILDSGSASGKILDMFGKNFINKLAVEPSFKFKKILQKKKYTWFKTQSDVLKNYKNKVDLIISSKVIEHVNNPLNYLKEIYDLLKEGGRAVITTPNRQDVLLNSIGEKYFKFFYRTQHLWYFDSKSLTYTANKAGFDEPLIEYKHFYNIDNFLVWYKTQKPAGKSNNIGIFDKKINDYWKSWLINNGTSDTMVLFLKKPYN
tara:strand:+ start:4517 stop:5419 length:903 start_codon:yes stop_codon:yes gene_type:complete